MEALKTKLVLVFFCIFGKIYTQVGINTSTPQATFDVNGNVMIRTVPETTNLSSYKIMVLNSTNAEVSKADPSLFASSTNSTASKAYSSSGINLLALSLGVFDNTWNIVKFDTTPINPANFTSTTTDFYYTVPSSGKYVELNLR